MQGGQIALPPETVARILAGEHLRVFVMWEPSGEDSGVLIEDGHVTALTLAVIDVCKEDEKGNDGHGSKILVIPFDGAAMDRDLAHVESRSRSSLFLQQLRHAPQALAWLQPFLVGVRQIPNSKTFWRSKTRDPKVEDPRHRSRTLDLKK